MKTGGKTRSCLKSRETLRYFTNLGQELKMEDTQGFKEILIMSYEDFKKLLNSIEQYITPYQVNGGNTRKIGFQIAIPSNR